MITMRDRAHCFYLIQLGNYNWTLNCWENHPSTIPEKIAPTFFSGRKREAPGGALPFSLII
jgi:hypothetical protein